MLSCIQEELFLEYFQYTCFYRIHFSVTERKRLEKAQAKLVLMQNIAANNFLEAFEA